MYNKLIYIFIVFKKNVILVFFFYLLPIFLLFINYTLAKNTVLCRPSFSLVVCLILMSDTPPAPRDYYHFIGDMHSDNVVAKPFFKQSPQYPHRYMRGWSTLLYVQNGPLSKDAVPTADFSDRLEPALSYYYSMPVTVKVLGVEVGMYVKIVVWSPEPLYRDLHNVRQDNHPIPIMFDNAGFHASINEQGYYDMFHYAYIIACKNGRKAMKHSPYFRHLPSFVTKTKNNCDIPLMFNNSEDRRVHCGGQPCNLLKIQVMGWCKKGGIPTPHNDPRVYRHGYIRNSYHKTPIATTPSAMETFLPREVAFKTPQDTQTPTKDLILNHPSTPPSDPSTSPLCSLSFLSSSSSSNGMTSTPSPLAVHIPPRIREVRKRVESRKMNQNLLY